MILEGKNALVTGASRGIGKAIALELASNGANIIVNYAGNEQAAQEVRNEIEKLGRKATIIKANVGIEEEVNQMVETSIKECGSIDILVNNAGITKDNLMLRMKEEEWDSVIDINLKGVFLTSKATVKYMLKQRSGKIINITSVVGLMGNPGQANYVAAKSGIIGLTKTMAKEFATRGIRVNAVAPGFIETDMTDVLKDETRNDLIRQIPLGTLGKAEDISKAVLFLASDDSNYITGQTLSVNGGMYM
jgi:3-oxoacyl-[acyl-carrier protein] reductase